MILVNDVKYACSECIRGHRSTSCRHYMRALLRVRSKGRPNDQFPQGNKNYRVAVFATEVEDTSLKKEDGCKNTPVIILKVSDKQVMDVTSGHIVGPYREKDPRKLQVDADSFVNSTSCCSSGVSKPRRKKCSCNHGDISKQSILTSYLNKKLALQRKSTAAPGDEDSPSPSNSSVKTEPGLEAPSSKGGCCVSAKGVAQPASCCSDKAANSAFPQVPFYAYGKHDDVSSDPSSALSDGFDRMSPEQTEISSITEQPDRVFQVIPVEPCSLPGTCSCSSNCSCPTCVVHNNVPQDNSSFEFLNNDTQYGSNIILTSASNAMPSFPPDRAFNGPKDIFNQLLSQYIGPSAQGTIPPFLNELQKDFSREGLAAEGNAQSTSSCNCPDNACLCLNCEQHGIIDGYHLDDYFNAPKVDL